jgi:hypothetical protein
VAVLVPIDLNQQPLDLSQLAKSLQALHLPDIQGFSMHDVHRGHLLPHKSSGLYVRTQLKLMQDTGGTPAVTKLSDAEKCVPAHFLMAVIVEQDSVGASSVKNLMALASYLKCPLFINHGYLVNLREIVMFLHDAASIKAITAFVGMAAPSMRDSRITLLVEASSNHRTPIPESHIVEYLKQHTGDLGIVPVHGSGYGRLADILKKFSRPMLVTGSSATKWLKNPIDRSKIMEQQLSLFCQHA